VTRCRFPGLSSLPRRDHVEFTARSRGAATVAGMKMQLVTLFGLAAYLVWTTTFAGMLAGLIPTGS
jgi:hypothetical protein